MKLELKEGYCIQAGRDVIYVNSKPSINSIFQNAVIILLLLFILFGNGCKQHINIFIPIANQSSDNSASDDIFFLTIKNPANFINVERQPRVNTIKVSLERHRTRTP